MTMLLAFYIYLCDVLPKVGTSMKGLASISVIILLLVLLIMTCIRKKLHLYRYVRKISITIAIIWLIGSIIPQKSTMYMMAGAYIGQQALDNKNTNELLSRTYQLLLNKLDQQKDKSGK